MATEKHQIRLTPGKWDVICAHAAGRPGPLLERIFDEWVKSQPIAATELEQLRAQVQRLEERDGKGQ